MQKFLEFNVILEIMKHTWNSFMML